MVQEITVEDTNTNNDVDELLLEDNEELVLTTMDNPHNPKTDYEKWYTWDIENGYHTESYLARVIDMDEELDIDDELQVKILTDRAVQSILDNDTIGIYKLI